MPIRLPLKSLLVPVRRISARISVARLARYSNALLLLPLAPTADAWADVVDGALLKKLFARKIRKAGDTFQIRVGRNAEALLTVATVPAEASIFERLQAAGKLARAALEGEPSEFLLWQHGLEPRIAAEAQCAVIAALQAATFALADFKSKPTARRTLSAIDIVGKSTELKSLDATLATQAGNNLARWLTALPPNQLDARGYRRLLEELARHLGLTYTFYGENRLKRLGAGAFLAVSQANPTRDAGIVHLAYRPAGGTSAAVSLVGKGVCFDTGGTNLKPHKSMLDMHTDMEGSAVAVGSLYALHMLDSPLAIDCWLAITENNTGPLAYKPQDVVTAMNGTTIQVIHTDAEGRMILADALCLAASKKPKAIIDYATLTGACVYALTERYSGAFTNRPEMRELIEAAGVHSGERVWMFPMDPDYDADLDSSVADIVQCTPDGKGDHIYAARFLSRFVPTQIPWLHLDLAAGSRPGGLAHIATDITGFGVRYTLELIEGGWPRAAAMGR